MKKYKKMKKSELKEYHELLIKKKLYILEELKIINKDTLNKSLRDASGDLSGYSFHMADVATDNYDREFSFGIAAGENKQLRLVDDALKRIEEGVYGKCSNCENQIKISRLKAIPQADLCISCQSEEEKKNKI